MNDLFDIIVEILATCLLLLLSVSFGLFLPAAILIAGGFSFGSILIVLLLAVWFGVGYAATQSDRVWRMVGGLDFLYFALVAGIFMLAARTTATPSAYISDLWKIITHPFTRIDEVLE